MNRPNMENTLMKTAEEVIVIIQELPPEEREKVAEYLNASEEQFMEEDYSPEDAAKILKSVEEADRGINVSPELEGDEAIAYLQRLRRA